ncbi:hypothetical protein IT415_01200 [bacterium]|nr:hypothetical protein [bacterium]
MAEAKSKSTGDLITVLEPYFTKQAPFQLPENARKTLVQWLPWINIVVAIFGALAALSLLTLLGIANVATAGLVTAVAGPFLWVPFFALVAQVVIQFIAFPGLQAKKLSAWKLLFWADILSFVYNLLYGFGYPSALFGNILGGLLGLVIGLYLLFQIKSYYK